MKKIGLLFTLFIVVLMNVSAQIDSNLPYYQIPDYPEKYTAETTAARMIDGLGFRYYWGTEGLRPEDLSFKPSKDGRTTAETIDHIYGLSLVILNATLKQPNDRTIERPKLSSFLEKRKATLENLKRASDILKSCEEGAIKDFKMVFKRADSESVFPFWNNINGPIADAIWHVGQVVSHRRTSGNPFNSKVSVLNGKLRD